MADKDLQFIKRVMERATNEAVSRYHEYLLTEHLLLSLTQEKTFTDLVTRCKGTLNGLITDVETYLSSESLRSPWTGTDIEPKESKRLIELIRRASAQDAISGNSDLTLVSLVLMMVTEERSHSAAYLKKHGVTREKILEILEPALQSGTGTGSNVTDPLGAYCVNLTEQAEKIDPLVGRDDIIDQLVHVLGRRKKSNAILTGEAGVGKTAIVEGLAKRIVDGEIPDSLKDYEIYSLDVAALMAGTKFRGDAEERIKSIIDELCSKDKVILFIDEMHSAMSAGQTKDSALDLGNMLKPKLANGEIKVIGATTNAEYYEQIESDRALVRRFAHVIHRERRDRCGRKRLHLDAGDASACRARDNIERVRVRALGQLDRNVIEAERMAQRDEVGGALRRHDAGDSCRREHVALGVLPARQCSKCARTEQHGRASDGRALARGLI